MTELATRFFHALNAAMELGESRRRTAGRLVRTLLPPTPTMLRAAHALLEKRENARALVQGLEGGSYKEFADPTPEEIYRAMIEAEISDDGGPKRWPA